MNKVRCSSGIIPSDVHGVGQRLNKEILVWHKLDHENIMAISTVVWIDVEQL